MAVPMLMADPDLAPGVCDTPVSLLDLAAGIPAHFGLTPDSSMVGVPLAQIAAGEAPADRAVFSEYHAVGAVNGAFMLRKGRFKLIHYVGFEDELFDLEEDPEETRDLAGDPAFRAVYEEMTAALREICDPQAVNRKAHEDQRAMVDGYGGLEAVRGMGPKGATPPPQVSG